MLAGFFFFAGALRGADREAGVERLALRFTVAGLFFFLRAMRDELF